MPDEPLDEPIDPVRAKTLVGEILRSGGTFAYSTHATNEMAKDGLSIVDCVNVLKGGVAEFPEFEKGTWRYRFRTNRIVVVVAFRSKTELRIVTAWRI
ncbi:MAG: DUF4258 domain-containing protein [Gammaproteobacteria bacterium]